MACASSAWHASAGCRSVCGGKESRPLDSLSHLYSIVKAAGPHEGRALSSEQVADICAVVENISLEDLGVDSSLAQVLTYGSARSARELRARLRPRAARGTVTYLDIHDDPTMTIGIFQLPPGARMPLHDHPGMTVFSRLLYGTLHVRAYDWADSSSGPSAMSASPSGSPRSSSSGSSSHTAEHGLEGGPLAEGLGAAGRAGPGSDGSSGSSSVRPARLVTDRVLTAPSDTMVLFPQSGGNIHAFTAISECAILDVLTPPYGTRPCTYYREVFPPQWVDAQGQPSIVPSEDVASWVAWEQAGSRQAPAGPAPAQPGGVDSGGGRGPLQYPDALSCAADGRRDIVVGLEVWREPADFHVSRGTYLGKQVTLPGTFRGGEGI